MAQIGKSVAPIVPFLLPSTVYSAGLQQGAAVVADSVNKGSKAPAGAAALGFQGFIHEAQATAGTVSGDRVSLQNCGVALGLLKAGQSCTFGQELVIGGTDGSLIAFDLSSHDDCTVVGTALVTLTAGSNADPIPVLCMPFNVHKDAV